MATNPKSQSAPQIVIEPHQWEELYAILERFASGHTIWAFGSRATGKRIRRFSDLDLLIGDPELSFMELATLAEALDESRLPFKVDITQLAYITADFRSRIQDDLVLLLPSS